MHNNHLTCKKISHSRHYSQAVQPLPAVASKLLRLGTGDGDGSRHEPAGSASVVAADVGRCGRL
jgi:hypothetical protein